MELESEEEKIEEVEVLKKYSPKIKEETMTLKVLIIKENKILGSTQEGYGYSVPISKKYKDVKVGDTITVKK